MDDDKVSEYSPCCVSRKCDFLITVMCGAFIYVIYVIIALFICSASVYSDFSMMVAPEEGGIHLCMYLWCHMACLFCLVVE